MLAASPSVRERSGFQTARGRPRASKAHSVVLPLASVVLVAVPQAGSTSVVEVWSLGLVEVLDVSGP